MSNLFNSLSRLIRYEPRAQIDLILFLISLYAIFAGEFYTESINIFTAVLTAVILDGLILRYQKGRWVFPYSSVVTGFLVGLILNPDFSAWQFISVAAIAIVSKYLILPGKKHIFNPAAFGLLSASFLFDGSISWWGVSWSPQVWLFIFIAVGFVLGRLRRIWLPIGFILVYWLYLSIQTGLSLTLISDPSVALFAFVMLPEPQTSPIKGYFRYLFGILVAFLLIFYSTLIPQLPTDPLLASLFSANLIAFLLLRPNLLKPA